MKCPACESRIGFELKILRKSKSAKRKRAEAEDHQRKREIVQRLESEANAERVQLAAEPGCICETIGFPTGSTWDAELQVMRPIKPRHHYQCPRNPNYMPPGTRLERDGDDDADAG